MEIAELKDKHVDSQLIAAFGEFKGRPSRELDVCRRRYFHAVEPCSIPQRLRSRGNLGELLRCQISRKMPYGFETLDKPLARNRLRVKSFQGEKQPGIHVLLTSRTAPPINLYKALRREATSLVTTKGM